MMLVPGMPKVPFLVCGVGLVILGQRLVRRDATDEIDDAVEPTDARHRRSPQQLAIDARVEPLELDLSFDLIELVDAASGGDLLDRVGALRRKLAAELGFVMPAIRTRDDTSLPPSQLRPPRPRRRGRPGRSATRTRPRDRRPPRPIPGRRRHRAGVRTPRPLGADRVPGRGRGERQHGGRPLRA